MSFLKYSTSRRNFIKTTGIAACTPFIGSLTMAESVLPAKKKANEHRVLTCNIRVALPEDEEKGVGWSDRKNICLQIIKAQKADIISFQEVIKVQADDLKKAFRDYMLFGFAGPYMDAYPVEYHWVAKNPVLFSKSRYELVSAGTYWLSETPLIAGSKSWGTARARQANWVRLKDRQTHKEFRVLNTHLDHLSQNAREEQTNLMMKECTQYVHDFPQILTGDFNVHVPNPIFNTIRDGGYSDTYAEVHGDADPGFTYHNFKGAQFVAEKKGDNKIDFIFTKGKLKTISAEIIKDSRGGIYPSDHYFVSADLQIL